MRCGAMWELLLTESENAIVLNERVHIIMCDVKR